MGCSCGKDACSCSVPQILYLKDEAGEAHGFYITDRLHVQHREYALLSGVEDADLVALLRVERDESGQEQYVNIQSEAEWTMLQETLFQPRW